ncbi:MAG TPA: glycosyltransferase [Actinomycetes bacterium]|nr:glycosyltransferase [Actinomycetes bacterium]
MPPAAVVIPAFREATRVGATVRAAAALPGVELVVVVDDASPDATAEVAAEAGAVVLRRAANRGKGGALELGVAEVDVRLGPDAEPLVFLDADLEGSASAAEALLEPVVGGAADLAIGVLPPQRREGGGRGFVVRLARDGIAEATGWAPEQPLSGQRCLTRAAYRAALPLAHGWGVEVGMTIDLLRAGFRVVEVPADLHHRVSGAGPRAQVHRGQQHLGVWRALRARGVGPRVPLPR